MVFTLSLGWEVFNKLIFGYGCRVVEKKKKKRKEQRWGKNELSKSLMEGDVVEKEDLNHEDENLWRSRSCGQVVWAIF